MYILERNGRGSKVVKVDQSRIGVRFLTTNLLQTPGVVVDEDATAYYAFLCPCCFSCYHHTLSLSLSHTFYLVLVVVVVVVTIHACMT